MHKLLGFLFRSAVLATLLTASAVGQDWSRAYSDTHINYITWDGEKWSAKPNGTTFVIAPNGDWSKGQSSEFVDYVTWDRGQWRAKLQENGTFLLAHHY